MYWELCLVSTSNKFSLTDSLSPRRARGGELEVPTFWYAKISILWNIPLPVRIAAKRFRWCWTYPCTSKLTWKIAKCAATPLRSVTPCRTTSWRNFRPGLWEDDAKLECQRIAPYEWAGWRLQWESHATEWTRGSVANAGWKMRGFGRCMEAHLMKLVKGAWNRREAHGWTEQ